MSIYSKLAEARVKLQEKGLAKSGRNHFIKVKVAKKSDDGRTYYQDEPMPYFELGDFLPEINKIFNELKMCSVVSFNEHLATLTIFDAESDGKIEFTSPMPKVPTQNAKGDIASNTLMQSIGALETYQRRYLYVSALEIVESDAIDSQDFSEEKNEQSPKPKSPSNSKPSTQTTNSTPPLQAKKSTIEQLKEGLRECKSKQALEERYSKQMPWLEQNHPELLDEYNSFYDECLFNLTM